MRPPGSCASRRSEESSGAGRGGRTRPLSKGFRASFYAVRIPVSALQRRRIPPFCTIW